MPIHAPLLTVFGVKLGENGNILHCYPSRNAKNPELTSYEPNRIKIGSAV